MPGRVWTGEEKGQHSVINIDHKYTNGPNIPGNATSGQPWSTAGKQVSFKQIQEACLVQTHRTEKSDWNRKIEDSRKWSLTWHWQTRRV